jgi:hypothetical protein
MARRKKHAKKRHKVTHSGAIAKKLHALSTKVHNLEVRKLDKKKFRKLVKHAVKQEVDTSPNAYAQEADYG